MPQVLLRRLREVMAARVSPQDRLDRVVALVASNLVAEVCSIYLVRDHGLVLSATHGLNSSAVGETRLAFGEGLIGQIARLAEPVSIADVQASSQFAYRPETGEDPYRSLMGVPILRSGHLLGVIAVQNRVNRRYSEDEIELLQTVAMVLAEVIASSQPLDPALPKADPEAEGPLTVRGLALAEGLAVGVAVLHEPRVRIKTLIAEDVEREHERLERAVTALRQQIDTMLSGAGVSLAGETRSIIEAFRMVAYDRGWFDRLREAVHSGLTAEAAVERVQSDMRARMQRHKDPYLRDRLHDLDDLANRLLRHLQGRSMTAARDELPERTVLVARNMGPAELLDYDRDKLAGLVLEEGSPNSHAAIVARALDIPMVGLCRNILERCETGESLIVDGDSARVYVRPDSGVLESYSERETLRRQRQVQFLALRDEPAVTLDGQRVRLGINAGLLVDLEHLDEVGADGIGLFRTELQFMVSSTMPRLDAQTKLYRRVLDAAGGRPVVFRTLDLGGDKVLPYMSSGQEENPAMGWRALRIALDRPALLRYQMRALLAAAAGHPLHVMFPMVAEASEFIRARKLLDLEVERARRQGRPLPETIRVGTMLEVPSLIWQLPALMPVLDFISVGSNDLVQFLFACDRGNARLAGRYDTLSPAMLSVLHHLVECAASYNVELSLCGEMAGHPLEAMALVGLGFRSISMPASRVGPVKMMVRSLHAGDLEGVIESLIKQPDHSLRPHLERFAKDHSVIA